MEDGWNSCYNDPITVTCLHVNKQACFIDSSQTGSTSKTGENHKAMCKEIIDKAKSLHGCSVQNIVTDNAKNTLYCKCVACWIKKTLISADLFVYGCNAHWLNLLAQDITQTAVTKHVIEIQKYFRNHHQSSAWLAEHEGNIKPHNCLEKHGGIASWHAYG